MSIRYHRQLEPRKPIRNIRPNIDAFGMASILAPPEQLLELALPGMHSNRIINLSLQLIPGSKHKLPMWDQYLGPFIFDIQIHLHNHTGNLNQEPPKLFLFFLVIVVLLLHSLLNNPVVVLIHRHHSEVAVR